MVGALLNIVTEGGFETLFISRAIAGAHKGIIGATVACDIDGVTATPGCCLDATARPIILRLFVFFIVIARRKPRPIINTRHPKKQFVIGSIVIIFHQTNILTNSPFFQMPWPVCTNNVINICA
jgi:hypothetical protein